MFDLFVCEIIYVDTLIFNDYLYYNTLRIN